MLVGSGELLDEGIVLGGPDPDVRVDDGRLADQLDASVLFAVALGESAVDFQDATGLPCTCQRRLRAAVLLLSWSSRFVLLGPILRAARIT